jgi:hypothetical protein
MERQEHSRVKETPQRHDSKEGESLQKHIGAHLHKKNDETVFRGEMLRKYFLDRIDLNSLLVEKFRFLRKSAAPISKLFCRKDHILEERSKNLTASVSLSAMQWGT